MKLPPGITITMYDYAVAVEERMEAILSELANNDERNKKRDAMLAAEKVHQQAIADAIDQREAETIKRCARACATFQVDYGTHICGELFAKHVRSLLRKQKP